MKIQSVSIGGHSDMHSQNMEQPPPNTRTCVIDKYQRNFNWTQGFVEKMSSTNRLDKINESTDSTKTDLLNSKMRCSA